MFKITNLFHGRCLNLVEKKKNLLERHRLLRLEEKRIRRALRQYSCSLVTETRLHQKLLGVQAEIQEVEHEIRSI